MCAIKHRIVGETSSWRNGAQRHVVAASDAFSVYQALKPGGAPLYALAQLGSAGNRRVQGALAWQVNAITGEDDVRFYDAGTSGPGFACGVNLGQPCGWGAVKAMKALAAVPAAQRTPAMQRAIEVDADFLFSHDPAAADYPNTERVGPHWFKFGFPLSYWSDVLETAAVLAELGYGGDARLAPAIELILSKQDAHGRWKLENALNRKM